MQAAVQLAGYTPSEARLLRKAVAKKKARGAAQAPRPVRRRARWPTDRPQATAERDLRRHRESSPTTASTRPTPPTTPSSPCQTAYLKAHYPIEYMTALMSVVTATTDKVALYIADCRRMGIEVLPPDVNAGGLDFDIEAGRRARRPSASAWPPSRTSASGRCRRFSTRAARRALRRRRGLRPPGRPAPGGQARPGIAGQVGALDSLCPRCNLLDALDRLISLSTAHFRGGRGRAAVALRRATGVSERLEMPASRSGVPVASS